MTGSVRLVWLACRRAPFAGVVFDAYLDAGGIEPDLVVLVPPDEKTGSRARSLLIALCATRPRDLPLLSRLAMGAIRSGRDPHRRALDAKSIEVDSIATTEAIDHLRSDRPTVIVANSFPQILPPEALATATVAALNIHHGRLPDYRGHHATFWEFHDQLDVGTVTVHRMSTVVDAGPAVASREIPLQGRSLFDVTIEKKRLAGALLATAVASAVEAYHSDAVAGDPPTAASASARIPVARPWPTIRELVTTRLAR